MALVVVSDIEHLAVLPRNRVAVQRLHLHVLAKRVLVARLFEFFLLGGKLLDDLLDSNALRLLGAELALLSNCAAEENEYKNRRENDASKFHDDPGIIVNV